MSDHEQLIFSKSETLSRKSNYGKQILSTVAAQLKSLYGRNFEEKNLRRMLLFTEQFLDIEIVVTLSRQLSWSHLSSRDSPVSGTLSGADERRRVRGGDSSRRGSKETNVKAE